MPKMIWFHGVLAKQTLLWKTMRTDRQGVMEGIRADLEVISIQLLKTLELATKAADHREALCVITGFVFLSYEN